MCDAEETESTEVGQAVGERQAGAHRGARRLRSRAQSTDDDIYNGNNDTQPWPV